MSFSNSNLTKLADQHTSALKEITYLKGIKKELKEDVENLTAKVTDLENQVAELKKSAND